MSNDARSVVIFCIFAQFTFGATIKGRLIEDHSGAPVPSANVRMIKNGVQGLVADLETDGEGRFEAAELSEGDYRLDISKPNFLNASVHLKLTNEAISNVRLVRCGAITGHALDRQGQPARGAYVFAMPRPKNGMPLMPEFVDGRYSMVDGRGNYRIYNLPPGQYAVVVSYGASRFAVGTSGSATTNPALGSGFLFYPDNSHPEFLTISPGEERRNLDFAIASSNMHTVSGKVSLSSPTARYWLALTPLDQTALAVAIAQTGADGAFRFTGIPSGSYHLLAAKTNGARTGMGAFLDKEPLFARSRVDVVTEDIADLAVNPEKGRPAVFVVRLAKSSGDASACPRTAQIVLTPIEEWGVIVGRRIAATLDKEETVSLAPARFVVSINGLGNSCYATAAPVVDLSGAGAASPVVLTIAAAGSIHGHLDTAGLPASGFGIVLMPVDSSDNTPAILVAHPDAESQFTFNNLRPGRYNIAVQPISDTSQSRWLSDAGKTAEVEVSGAATLEVNLTAPPPKP